MLCAFAVFFIARVSFVFVSAQIEPAPVANLHGYLRGHFSHLASETIEDEVQLCCLVDVFQSKLNFVCIVECGDGAH